MPQEIHPLCSDAPAESPPGHHLNACGYAL